jgi:DNA/RNA-binding domain of Phe-tRNA-synthetase-like protein
MKKFRIDPCVRQLYPDGAIGVAVIRGVNNHVTDKNRYRPLLDAAQEKTRSYLTREVLSENEVIHVWRDAFKKFKHKKGVHSAVESLMKRVSQGKSIGTINPLVDIYNSISLTYALPVGGEDMDKFVGDIRMTLADGDELFVSLGSTENEPPRPGELVYKDDGGIVCCTWRESIRTMLTEESTNIFMVVECVDPGRMDVMKAALADLAGKVTADLGGTAETFIVSDQNPEIVIEP